MSTSFRTTGKIYKADHEEMEAVTAFDTHADLSQYQDLSITLPGAGTFTVNGISSIKEITVLVDMTTVNVVMNAGSGNFTVPVSEMLLIRGGSLTALQLVNPSGTVPVDVRLIVGG